MKIQAFLSSLKSSLKGGSTYTTEEALWYAEATLNFSYAIYDSDFVYLSRDTNSFSIDLNENGTVNQSELADAYEAMVDSLESHYNRIQTSTKHVMLCDVKDVSNSVGSLDLMVVSVIACDYNPNLYPQFVEDDHWYSGALAGRCDNYYPPYIGRDATTELEYHLLHPLISPVQYVRVYYEPIVTVEDIDPENYPYTPAPRGTRGYWYGSNNPGDGVQCLEPDELNFYISNEGIPYIIADNDTFIDKEFCNIDIVWDFVPSMEIYYESHTYNISYGVPHGTQVNIIPF